MPGRLIIHGLYVITDSRLGRGRDVLEQARAAIAGGATTVQLREKDLATGPLIELGRALLEVTRPAGVSLIVNDRVDVALAIDADGVHLGQDDLSPLDARRLLGPGKIVGVSAGNPVEWARVAGQGADYVGVGPVYGTGSKADAGAAIGPGGVAAIRALTDLPIVAIGGITAENVGRAIAAGADGAAVISAVVGQDDMVAATRALADEIERSTRARP